MISKETRASRISQLFGKIKNPTRPRPKKKLIKRKLTTDISN